MWKRKLRFKYPRTGNRPGQRYRVDVWVQAPQDGYRTIGVQVKRDGHPLALVILGRRRGTAKAIQLAHRIGRNPEMIRGLENVVDLRCAELPAGTMLIQERRDGPLKLVRRFKSCAEAERELSRDPHWIEPAPVT